MSKVLLYETGETRLFYEIINMQGVDIVTLHLSLGEWSPSKYKEYLAGFFQSLQKIKALGYTTVYVIIKNDPKLIKFEELFGFAELAESENGEYMMMCQEIV